jgi:hypothetical protein
MTSVTMWLRDGAFATRPKKINNTDYHDKTLFDKFAMVRVLTDSVGTEVQWNMACPNWTSLMMAAKLVSACAGPFTLRYFNAGWFTEKVELAADAADRIDELIFKSDVHLNERAYTAPAPNDPSRMSDALRRILISGTAPDDRSVLCEVQPERETSQVVHIGKETLIAQIWGLSPNSYPCLSGHSFDRAVTPKYFNVVQTGRPHYDHVLASMVRPDGELHWLAYHRVILPEMRQQQKMVRIVSEVAPVDIQLL